MHNCDIKKKYTFLLISKHLQLTILYVSICNCKRTSWIKLAVIDKQIKLWFVVFVGPYSFFKFQILIILFFIHDFYFYKKYETSPWYTKKIVLKFKGIRYITMRHQMLCTCIIMVSEFFHDAQKFCNMNYWNNKNF